MNQPKSSSIFDNLGLKLIALVLALGLEAYFYSPDNSVTEVIPASIELRNIPRETIVVEPERAEKGIPAQIEVEGPRPLVEQVRSSLNKVPIDLPPTVPETYTVPVDLRRIHLPSGVRVLNISPPTVTIKTARVVRKELLIVVEKVGEPAPGYQIEGMNLFPDTVVVRGPESVVGKLRAVESEPVDVQGLSKSIRREVSLRSPSPLVSLGIDVVRVDIKVGLVKREKSFEDLPVKVLAPKGHKASVEPPRVDARLLVPLPLFETLTRDEVTITADAQSLPPGRHTLRLSGIVPEGVEVSETEPPRVEVRVLESR